MTKDIFISHSKRDNIIADNICENLESNGTDCWIAHRDIPPGIDWEAWIDESIKNIKILILLFSSASSVSIHVIRELKLAEKYNKIIIPVRLDNTELSGAFSYILIGKQLIDATDGDLNKLNKQLIKGINEHINQKPTETTPIKIGNNNSQKTKYQTKSLNIGYFIVFVLIIMSIAIFLNTISLQGYLSSPYKSDYSNFVIPTTVKSSTTWTPITTPTSTAFITTAPTSTAPITSPRTSTALGEGQNSLVILSDTQTQWLSSEGWKPVQLPPINIGWSVYVHISQAQWIWPYTYLDSKEKEGPFYFKRIFNVPNNANDIKGTLIISVDDNLSSVKLNGQDLGIINIGHFDKPVTKTIQPKAGENILEFIGENNIVQSYGIDPKLNPGGAIYRMNISYELP